MIFSCFGAPILRPFGANRCKKRSIKKSEKNDPKRERDERKKNGGGRVGSLKTEEIVHCSLFIVHLFIVYCSVEHWIKHALAYLKARWRIFIYIYIYIYIYEFNLVIPVYMVCSKHAVFGLMIVCP